MPFSTRFTNVTCPSVTKCKGNQGNHVGYFFPHFLGGSNSSIGKVLNLICQRSGVQSPPFLMLKLQLPTFETDSKLEIWSGDSILNISNVQIYRFERF